MPTFTRVGAALAGLGVALGLLIPGTAVSVTTVSYSASTGLRLEGDGMGDNLAVTDSLGATYLVTRGANPLSGPAPPEPILIAQGGCTQVEFRVSCAIAGNHVITASLREGADGLSLVNVREQDDSFVDGGGGVDKLVGGPGADLMDGGAGNDELFSIRDVVNDTLEGGDGDDSFLADSGGIDTIRGEAGNDTLRARDAAGRPDLFDGGPGVDTADYSARTGPVVLRASVLLTRTPDDGALLEGDDLDNVETLVGGGGADLLEISNSLTATAPPAVTYTLLGNAGADRLVAIGQVRTSMDGGAGADIVTGGAAPDSIFSREGEPDRITCGAAIDTIRPDLRDQPLAADCENLDQSDRREAPNVALRTKVARVDAEGLLNVRLSCPRAVRIGCRGTLAARFEGPGARFGAKESYALLAGRSTVVEVSLPAGQIAPARSRGSRVRVRSVEAGVHGPKTTQRSLPSRAG